MRLIPINCGGDMTRFVMRIRRTFSAVFQAISRIADVGFGAERERRIISPSTPQSAAPRRALTQPPYISAPPPIFTTSFTAGAQAGLRLIRRGGGGGVRRAWGRVALV